MHAPLVSVLMPSLNVAPYIHECLESVVNQTLEDLEIICIDAGSTDGTREILEEYALRDPRIKLLASDVKSYGHQMNMGLKAATGRFIGIVETDDFVDWDMFESLYKQALACDAHVVKANYYDYSSSPIPKNSFHERYKGLPYGTLLTVQERRALLEGGASIWSGIYDRGFLLDHGINFLETPGASFQDTSFILKVFMAAERVVLVKDAYLHYRNDNMNSSVHSMGKAYYVCDEMASAREFMNQREEWHDDFCAALWGKLVSVYYWNYRRLSDDIKLEFLQRMNSDLREAEELGELDMEALLPFHRAFAAEVLDDPESFYKKDQAALAEREKASQSDALEADDMPAAAEAEKYAKTTIRERGPLVSVIITTYNTRAYVVECLASVLGQTYDNCEVIIVDDGSRDDTVALIEKTFYRDQRISIFAMPHRGAGYQRNVGMRYARGTYLQFLDADDRFPSTMLETLVSKALTSDADIVCCGSKNFVDGTDEVTTCRNVPEVEDYDRAYDAAHFGDCLFTSFMGWAWDKLFARSFVEETGLRFQDLVSSNDVYFVFCALALARRVALVNEILPEHRLHSGSIEKSRQKYPHNAHRAHEAIANRLKEEPVWSVIEKPLALWEVEHLRWNYRSIHLPEKREAFDDYLASLRRVELMWPDEMNDEDRELLEKLAALDAVQLMLQAQEAEEKARKLSATVDRLRADLKRLRPEVKRLRVETREQRAELESAQAELEAVRHSQSFKIGRLVTALPRKMKDVINR